MPSASDFFLRLPLCEACERLFTAPKSTFDKLSIPDQMFATSEGYEYTRPREQLEASLLSGCELCKAILANDSSYSIEGTPQGGRGPCFDGQRPAWYPSMSQRLQVSFKRHGYNNLIISCTPLDEGARPANEPTSIEWSFFADEDDPCRHYIKASAPLKGLVHQRDFETAQHWLQKCGDSHRNCPNQTQTTLPTRLIELSPLGAPKTARLICTKGRNGIYIALSYCWGGSQPFKTTCSNINTYGESLPYSDLPKSILDAFEVARNLNFHLIWVDSLCIIQDDEVDVHRELAEMVQVYQNAKLTISAASSFGCHEGFLEPSYYGQNLFHFPVRVTKDTVGTLIVSKKSDTRGTWASASSAPQPINSRAWTLQETFLSPCLLIFTNNGMYWKCQSAFEPKLGTFSKMSAGKKLLESRTLLIEWGFFGYTWKHVTTCENAEIALNMWEVLLRNYTKRELSRKSDRLRAIAAAAEVFSYRLNCAYLAGHWMKGMLRSLKWRVESPKPLAHAYQAPSWSWASVNGPISYEVYQERMKKEVYTARVVECSTIPASEVAKWDAVTAGKLVIFGYLEEVLLSPDRTQISPLGRHKVRSDPLSWDNGWISGVCWDTDWRASPDHSSAVTTWLLILEKSIRAGYQHVDGLILQRATSDEDCCRRVAYFHNSGWKENPAIIMAEVAIV